MPRRILSPSEEVDSAWIFADGKGEGAFENGQTFVGKWLIFVPHESVDEVWKQIRNSVTKGKLGISAKVSTSRPRGYNSTDHVICVYTHDFRDEADVKRVLNVLRQIGIMGRLNYKTDQATINGIYAVDGPLTKKRRRSSLYTSDDFEK